jgi:hypothetical protein
MTTYQIDIDPRLWRYYSLLVGSDERITDRIEVLMARDVLEHQSRMPTPGVDAAKTTLQNSSLTMEVPTDGIES